MKIPLPNLDDRRWSDLVDEARSLIPLYAPDWTDHNIHDPGITLLELFAWIAEMDIYELNRITDEHKRKFLALVGVTPAPPSPGKTILEFHSREGSAPRPLVAEVEFVGKDPFGEPTRYRLAEPLTLIDGEIGAVQHKDSAGFHDLTPRYRRGESMTIFGDVPAIGNEFYIGFTKAFPANEPVTLYLAFEGGRSGEDERDALIAAASERETVCPGASDCCNQKAAELAATMPAASVPALNRVRISWEAYIESNGGTNWASLETARDEIEDQTRSLTLDGKILFRITAPMAQRQLGPVQTPLFYLRVKLAAGAFDAPPVARRLIFNAAPAVQSVPVSSRMIIEPGVVPQGTEPAPGDRVNFRLSLDERGHITGLLFEPPVEEVEGFLVLDYVRPTTTTPGSLLVMAVRAGKATGWPNQEVELQEFPIELSTFRLYTEENGDWRPWTRVDEFAESTRRDAHFVLDPSTGKLSFGDGENGRVPPSGANLFVVYRMTRAEKAMIPAGTDFKLDDSKRNRMLLADFDGIKADIAGVVNAAASSGEAAESLDHAIGRAIELVASTTRAVTLADYEELAKRTPGTRIARAEAIANLHASFPCFKAPGLVTVIIVPDQRGPRPVPGPGLLRDVADYLHPRRVIGTRVEVIAPQYLQVTVRATVQSLTGVSRSNLQQQIVSALNGFFDPITGGPDSTGWPFGRDLYRSEVMQKIDEVAGVDHVVKLELLAEGCAPQCGNICLAPTWLVASGAHEIEVI